MMDLVVLPGTGVGEVGVVGHAKPGAAARLEQAVNFAEQRWIILLIYVLHEVLAVDAIHGSVGQWDRRAQIMAHTPLPAIFETGGAVEAAAPAVGFAGALDSNVVEVVRTVPVSVAIGA